MGEKEVGKVEGSHGVDDGNGAWQHAGIGGTFALGFAVFALAGDCLMVGNERGGGFEGDAEEDVFAIRDAALDTARAVAGSSAADLFQDHRAVVLVTGDAVAGQACRERADPGSRERDSWVGGRGIKAHGGILSRCPNDSPSGRQALKSSRRMMRTRTAEARWTSCC